MPLEINARRAGRPLISAHRGFSAAAPENTLAALEAARRIGATVAEIDVQLSRDGHVVLMHDRDVRRTTNGTGLVKDLTLTELKTLDAGDWFNSRFRGERVPTLPEVLEWSGGRLGLLIEMKDYYDREIPLVAGTVRAVEAARAQDFVVLAGFDHVMLAEVHRHRPDWPLEMIYTCRLADPVHAARACGATLVSVKPEFCLEADVQAMHEEGVSVLTTLLSPAHAPELLRWGVDILESDDAGMVATTLGIRPRA